MILLDTHVLVWYISDPDKLSAKADKLIEASLKEGKAAISSISIWEMAMLVKKKRLTLTMDIALWIEKIVSLPVLKIIPVDHKIAFKSVYLPGSFHRDPADRMIVATAIINNCILITSDNKIRRYHHVKSSW